MNRTRIATALIAGALSATVGLGIAGTAFAQPNNGGTAEDGKKSCLDSEGGEHAHGAQVGVTWCNDGEWQLGIAPTRAAQVGPASKHPLVPRATAANRQASP